MRMTAFKVGLDEQDPADWDDEDSGCRPASTDDSEPMTVARVPGFA